MNLYYNNDFNPWQKSKPRPTPLPRRRPDSISPGPQQAYRCPQSVGRRSTYQQLVLKKLRTHGRAASGAQRRRGRKPNLVS